MKKKLFSMIAMALAVTILLSGCLNFLLPKTELTDAPLVAEKLINFADGANPEVLFASDGWTNGDVFNVVWTPNNVHYENGIMRLGITEEKVKTWLDGNEVEYSYSAGEARTQNYYHYGDYVVSMKPSANPGTASTFFTCTGPYDTPFVLDENGDYVLDENGQRVTKENAHDEIDIEFLGKDTTHVQFNYFVNGVGGHEYMHELGFDASEGFHEYGYRWEPTAITWFVDGKPVYKVTTDKSVKPAKNLVVVDVLPSTPGRILTNYWCGNARAEGWMGAYSGNTRDNGTEYQWIATSALGAPLNPPEEKPDDGENKIVWGAAVAPTFESTELYTVATEGNTARITYSAVGGSDYKNVEMDITDAAAGKNYIYLKVTNNGTTPVSVRVNVIDSALVQAGAQNVATNQSATQDGADVRTDMVWGGSFFDIAAGQTSELIVKFTGVVEKLQLMLDSSRNDKDTYSGDVSVTDIKFAQVGEVETPVDPDPNEPQPALPAITDELTFVTGTYTITPNNVATKTLDISYTNIAGGTYNNICAEIGGRVPEKGSFTYTLKNTGETAILVRTDIKATNKISTGAESSTDICNVSSSGGGSWTNTEWGGSFINLAAGAEVTITVYYEATEAFGPVTQLLIYFDTSTYQDTNTYSGSLTISNFYFAPAE